jgi:hypothetical protein
MSEGTTQAAAVGEATERLLQALRQFFGVCYQIGYDSEHGWWATRHGQVGHLLKGDSPEELRAAMIEDQGTAAS